MGNVDVARIRRLLREIDEALGVLRECLLMGREAFLKDLEKVYAARYAIVKIVEAIALIANHITSEEHGVTPESYGESLKLLGELRVIDPRLARELRRLVGLRNLLVHKYWDVDDARIYEEAINGGIDSIEEFMKEIKEYLNRRGYKV